MCFLGFIAVLAILGSVLFIFLWFVVEEDPVQDDSEQQEDHQEDNASETQDKQPTAGVRRSSRATAPRKLLEPSWQGTSYDNLVIEEDQAEEYTSDVAQYA